MVVLCSSSFKIFKCDKSQSSARFELELMKVLKNGVKFE